MSNVVDKIPEGWVETSLIEVANYINRGVTPKYSEHEGICVLNQRCIRDRKVSFENARLNNLKLRRVPDDKIVKLWDVLICSTGTGTLGRVAQIKEVIGPTTVDSHVTIVRPNEGIDKSFFGQLLGGKEREIEFMAEGSTGQTELPRKKLGELPLLIPTSLQEQKALAQVLTAFDAKIENLRAQNQTLETLAQTIFKEWFGKYQMGDDLPEGWRVATLGEIAFNHSKTFKFSEENVIFINTGDVSEGQFLHSNEISPKGLPGQAKKVIELYDILYSEIRPKNKRFAFVDFETPNYVVSTKFMVIRPKEDFSPHILYLLLKNQDTINEFNVIAESRSGTFPQITFDSISDFPVVIPTKEFQNKFEKILKPLMEKERVNHQQIQSLTKTRDTLLPKLMSGKLRLKEFDKLEVQH